MSDTRSRVLGALRAAGERGVSGEALAAELGVTRAAVGKHVATLREAGYAIDAAAGTGYRLVAVPDLPLPEEVAPLLGASAGFWRLDGGGTTGSTNDDAKARAREGAPEGSAVLAARQTAGRGRLGREWVSPEGGLYVSAVLRPLLAPVEVAPLALAIGLGAARALGSLGVASRLKWPNDVLAPDGRKLAGILLETSAEADLVEWVVAGVGLNVRRPAEDAVSGAAYIAELAPEPVSLAAAAAALLDGVADAYRAFLGDGYAGLRDEYDGRLALIGRTVTVRDAVGRVLAEGEVAGTDASGRLVLDAAGVTTAVAAGEVTLRPRGA